VPRSPSSRQPPAAIASTTAVTRAIFLIARASPSGSV
jgi:hypothetical protein